MKVNIFIRESAPITLKNGEKVAPKSQQSTDKHYFSASIVLDEGGFKDLGFFKPLKKAKEILEDHLAKGDTIPGVSKAGEYQMLPVEVEDKDWSVINDTRYLKNIRDVLLERIE